MPPTLLVTINSRQLGMSQGTLEDLDAALRVLQREHVVLRTIAVLNALGGDSDSGMRNVSMSFAGSATGNVRRLLGQALREEKTRFIDPLQQLLILRRAMTVCRDIGSVDIASAEGFETYFNVCRFASDLLSPQPWADDGEPLIEKWLRVAAGLSMRLWLTNAPNPNHTIARMRLILDRLPVGDQVLAQHALALKQRFTGALGLTYDDISLLVAFLGYWSLSTDWTQIFKDPNCVRLEPSRWLAQTNISVERLERLLNRIARSSDEELSDSSYGGALSLLPFRDRPLIGFKDGTFAPVMRELVLEKITSDVFWWVKGPNKLQERPWQQDWGCLGEAYALWLLESLARASNCQFARNVKWGSGELDAAIWFKGHVALIEITTSTMSDVAAFAGDPESFRRSLHQTFVESQRPGKQPYHEAVLQLARDVKLTLAGDLRKHMDLKSVQRVYPVVIAFDRKLRVPGAWHYLNQELQRSLGSQNSEAAALAVLNIEDLEDVEQLLNDRPQQFRGTPPGFLRILRRWDTDRGVGPSWWQFMEYLAQDMNVNRHLLLESKLWKTEIERHFGARSGESSV